MHPAAARQAQAEPPWSFSLDPEEELLSAADGEQTRASEEYAEGLVDGHASLDVNQLAQALKAGPDQQEEPHFLQLQDVSLSSVCDAVSACLSLCVCMHVDLSACLCPLL